MGVRRRWFTFWDNGLLSVIRHDLVRPCMQWQNKPSEQLNSTHPHFILLLVRQSTLIRLVARNKLFTSKLLKYNFKDMKDVMQYKNKLADHCARRIKKSCEFGMIFIAVL